MRPVERYRDRYYQQQLQVREEEVVAFRQWMRAQLNHELARMATRIALREEYRRGLHERVPRLQHPLAPGHGYLGWEEVA